MLLSVIDVPLLFSLSFCLISNQSPVHHFTSNLPLRLPNYFSLHWHLPLPSTQDLTVSWMNYCKSLHASPPVSAVQSAMVDWSLKMKVHSKPFMSPVSTMRKHKILNMTYKCQPSYKQFFSQELPLYALVKGLDESCSLLPQGPGYRTQDLLKWSVSDMWRH